jgi:hypothetical protein
MLQNLQNLFKSRFSHPDRYLTVMNHLTRPQRSSIPKFAIFTKFIQISLFTSWPLPDHYDHRRERSKPKQFHPFHRLISELLRSNHRFMLSQKLCCGRTNIKALYQDPEVWEYLDGILKESSESLNLWTVIEKRVCSKRIPSISNMLNISRGPTGLETTGQFVKRSVFLDEN